MNNHERIWLQPGAETTWCKDRINDDDVEYVRADIAAATIERLTKERDKARQERAHWKQEALQAHWKQEAYGYKWQKARADSLAAELAKTRQALTKIAEAPAWGAPDRWETTPAEVRQLTRAALAASPAPTVNREPVAWQHRFRKGFNMDRAWGNWRSGRAEMYLIQSYYQERPLFAHVEPTEPSSKPIPEQPAREEP